MMKPTELTPGATVSVKGLGVVEVVAIWKSVVRVSNNFFNEEYFNFKEIRPITLTPKIVEKLGFKEIKRDDSPYRYYKRGRVEIWFFYGELDSIWSNKVLLLNNPTKKERSVHYLQKFLAEYTKIKIDFSKLLK